MNHIFEESIEEFLSECTYIRSIKPETLRGYRLVFVQLLKLMPDITFHDLTPTTITLFFTLLHQRRRISGKQVKVGLKPSTVALYWTKLNNFCSWLVERNYLRVNPFLVIKCPSPVYVDHKYLYKKQVEKIIAAIYLHDEIRFTKKRNLLIVHLLLFCGLRKGELLGLQLRDIDSEKRLVTVRGETSKSGRSRTIPLHSSIMIHLKDYMIERKKYTTPFLIASCIRDDGLTGDGLKHMVNRIKRHSGVLFHLHQFRHTFAVNFLRSSNNIAKLQILMGHQDIRMTIPYLRCLPTSEMKGDIEALNIDSFL